MGGNSSIGWKLVRGAYRQGRFVSNPQNGQHFFGKIDVLLIGTYWLFIGGAHFLRFFQFKLANFGIFYFPTGTNSFPYKYELLAVFLPYRYELFFLTSTNSLHEALPYRYEFFSSEFCPIFGVFGIALQGAQRHARMRLEYLVFCPNTRKALWQSKLSQWLFQLPHKKVEPARAVRLYPYQPAWPRMGTRFSLSTPIHKQIARKCFCLITPNSPKKIPCTVRF
jgi:hypothetical protein